MFTIYYINFGYGPEVKFDSFDDAVAYGKSKCFEFNVIEAGNKVIGTWSPIGGLRKL